MEKIVPIVIGPVTIVFTIGVRGFALKVMDRYRGYLAQPGGRAGLRIACSCTKKKLGANERLSLREAGVDSWRALRYDLDCQWNGSTGVARIWPSLYSFDALLRVMCATQIMRHNGLLLHSSGIVFRNAAFIFAGPSESGKTTVARLSCPKRILSDEIVALTCDPQRGILAHGTPFWGEMGTGPASRKRYRVGSLFFLEKSDHLQKVPIAKGTAVQKLLRCVCFFSRAPHESARALDLCLHVIETAEVCTLQFPKKPLDWNYLFLK